MYYIIVYIIEYSNTVIKLECITLFVYIIEYSNRVTKIEHIILLYTVLNITILWLR